MTNSLIPLSPKDKVLFYMCMDCVEFFNNQYKFLVDQGIYEYIQDENADKEFQEKIKLALYAYNEWEINMSIELEKISSFLSCSNEQPSYKLENEEVSEQTIKEFKNSLYALSGIFKEIHVSPYNQITQDYLVRIKGFQKYDEERAND